MHSGLLKLLDHTKKRGFCFLALVVFTPIQKKPLDANSKNTHAPMRHTKQVLAMHPGICKFSKISIGTILFLDFGICFPFFLRVVGVVCGVRTPHTNQTHQTQNENQQLTTLESTQLVYRYILYYYNKATYGDTAFVFL